MNGRPSETISKKELQDTLHKLFVAEVIKLKNSNDKEKIPWWKQFLLSGSGTALITVIIGGLMGGYLTSQFQQETKAKELAILYKQQLLNKRDEITKSSFDLIGNALSTSVNIKEVMNDPGATDKNHEEAKKKFDEAKQKWILEKDRTILLLKYYYKNNTEIGESWSKLNNLVSNFFKVAELCYISPKNCNLNEESKTSENKSFEQSKLDLDTEINNLGRILVSKSLEDSEK